MTRDPKRTDRFCDMKNMSADLPARSCLAYISTTTVDEEGEAVLPGGIQTNRFNKTRSVFWNHDYADPVAVNRWLRLDGDGIVALTVFPERPEGHAGEWRPDTILAMLACDPPLVRGVSIGFAYVETRQPTKKDSKSFPTTGNKLKQVVSKSRLLEYSFTPLPMNEDALIVATQKGLIRDDFRINEKAFGPKPSLRLKRGALVLDNLPNEVRKSSDAARAVRGTLRMMKDELDRSGGH